MAVNTANNLSDNNIAPNQAILLHELQLGEQLNESVHQARRADFSLMLAMLCDDVREHSQFILPQSEDRSAEQSKQTNEALRKHFDLPEQAPLALKDLEQISQYNQGQLVAEDALASIKLSNALSPKPLTFRDDEKHIETNVLNNTSLTCQEKHLNQSTPVLNKRVNMHVENWLKTVQTSLVKSTMTEALVA